MPDEFTTELRALRRVANVHLPQLEALLSSIGPHLPPQTGYTGAYGNIPEQAMEIALAECAEALVDRLQFGVRAVAETAETLRDIADLYARADGQE